MSGAPAAKASQTAPKARRPPRTVFPLRFNVLPKGSRKGVPGAPSPHEAGAPQARVPHPTEHQVPGRFGLVVGQSQGAHKGATTRIGGGGPVPVPAALADHANAPGKGQFRRWITGARRGWNGGRMPGHLLLLSPLRHPDHTICPALMLAVAGCPPADGRPWRLRKRVSGGSRNPGPPDCMRPPGTPLRTARGWVMTLIAGGHLPTQGGRRPHGSHGGPER